MRAVKFDEEKVKGFIDTYHDQYGIYPYLICNAETKKMLPVVISGEAFTYPSLGASLSGVFDAKIETPAKTIMVDDRKYILESENVNKSPGTWYGAKVLIDNSLEFGEVHIG